MRVSFGHEREFRLWMVYRLWDDEEKGVVSGMYPYEDAEQIGAIPDWLDYEQSNSGWSELVAECSHRSLLEWGLRNGIAPGQPFLVRFGHPSYIETNTVDGHEYDVEYDHEIVLVEPIPDAAARWDEAISIDLEENEAMLLEQLERAYQARHAQDRMQLRTSQYFAPRDCYWDDMAMPSGIQVDLVGRDARENSWWVQIASGRDDRGDYKKALEQLVGRAAFQLPHLSPTFIRGLRRFNV